VVRLLDHLVLVSICLLVAVPLLGREKDAAQYGMGLIVNLPFPESEVSQVLDDVVRDGIIRGSKEYNKDEYISGAEVVSSTKVFPPWTEGGKVFYKVRMRAIDPRNFKNTNDVGTLAVRYVVQPQGDKNTVLRIDALFVEDFRHGVHASNGSVESEEYKDIHDRLDQISLMQEQTAEALKEKRSKTPMAPSTPPAEQAVAPADAAPAAPTVAANSSQPDIAQPEKPEQTPAQTLEQRVEDLRRQTERVVKAPGAALRSAPFHTASTLTSLPAGANVLVVISTTYWLGVETHEGQHGWILRDDLEMLP
jgi:hypothetical protein